MRYLRLLWTFFRVGAMGELAYRVNFFVQLVESVLELGTAIAGLAVIFSYTRPWAGGRPTRCSPWWASSSWWAGRSAW